MKYMMAAIVAIFKNYFALFILDWKVNWLKIRFKVQEWLV